MGRRGPPPKPTKLRLLQGNPGKRPLNRNEPVPTPKVPKCPEHLSDAAKKEWRRVTKELSALRLLTLLDRAALAAYCQAWGRWVEAEEKLKQFGTIVKSPNGYPMQSPFVSVVNQAIKQMASMLVEFGMTPASRSRLHVEERDQAADEYEKFRNAKKNPRRP